METMWSDYCGNHFAVYTYIKPSCCTSYIESESVSCSVLSDS